MKQYRQGDILLVSTNDALQTENPVKPQRGKVIVAFGEVTGHHHALPAEDVTAYQVGERMQLVVAKTTSLAHQEHATIEVAAGTYWIIYQREYQRGEVRRVID